MKGHSCEGATVSWAKQGNYHELDEGVRSLAQSCDRCATMIREVIYVRDLAAHLPVAELAEARVEQIRFLLMAEARQQRAPVRIFTQARSHRLRWALSAIVFGCGVAVAGGLLSKAHKGAPPDPVGVRSHLVTTLPAASLGLHDAGANVEQSERALLLPSASHGNESQESTPTQLADAQFLVAWNLYSSGNVHAAGAKFDELLRFPKLDPARVADILYWSAQSHRQSGDTVTARKRGETLLSHYPGAVHASDAALLLGEIAASSGQNAVARDYFKRALTSPHPVVKARAERALSTLPK